MAIVLWYWNFESFDELFFVCCLKLLLDTIDLSEICCPFQEILPLVVEALNCQDRFKVTLGAWEKLYRDCQQIFDLSIPVTFTRATYYLEKTVLSFT